MNYGLLQKKYPVEHVNIQNLKNYLKDRGWKEEPFGRAEVLKFKSPQPIQENEFLEVLIPSKRELIDYNRVVEIAIDCISTFEERDFEDVLSQILIFGDLFKVRIQTPKTKIGSIPISQGMLLYRSAYDLLVYSACAEVDLQKSYSRRLKEATESVDTYRIGQSQYGSFVANIHCQLIRPEILQMDIDSNVTLPPFERGTILRVLRGLKNVEDSIRKESPDPIVDNYSIGLNANMCDTLVDIVRIGLGNELKISVNLEPLWQIPNDIHTDISLQPSAEGYLIEAAEILKGETPKEKRELVGHVFQLRKKPAEKNNIVRIVTRDEEGETIPVTIKPDDDSYRLAINAHKDLKRIRVTGLLEKRGRTWYLNEPEGIEIINEEDYE